MDEATLLEYIVATHQHKTQDEKTKVDTKEGDKSAVAESTIFIHHSLSSLLSSQMVSNGAIFVIRSCSIVL